MKASHWGFYFHIPFCLQKCSYCDFYSFEAFPEQIQSYGSYLAKEVLLLKEEGGVGEGIVDSIYLGGGTPSLLESSAIQELLKVISDNFSVAHNAEITMEINPGLHTSPLAEYLEAGVNRLSIGIQSTIDHHLCMLGRNRDKKALPVFMKNLPENGDYCISMDFLYGIPYQSLEDLQTDLAFIEQHSPHHVSYYQLTFYEDTALYDKQRKGEVYIPSEEELLSQERLLSHKLAKSGYCRYEVSNFAKNRWVSRHNLKYWQLQPYYGFGEGSSSFFHNSCHENFSGRKYYEVLDKGQLPVKTHHCYTPEQMIQNMLIMGLRLTEGISWQKIQTSLDVLSEKKHVYEKKIYDLRKRRVLEIYNGRLRVNPKFYWVLDSILLEFI